MDSRKPQTDIYTKVWVHQLTTEEEEQTGNGPKAVCQVERGVYLGLQCLFDAVEAILFDFIRDDQISSGYRRLKNGRCFLLYEY